MHAGHGGAVGLEHRNILGGGERSFQAVDQRTAPQARGNRDSIEMREVSPAGGLLPNEERLQVLQMAG